MSREGMPQTGWFGVSRMNPSLQRQPRPFVTVRLMHLGHVGMKIPAEYYGDEITWDDAEGLHVQWGDSEALLYTELKAGWSYIWNLGRKTLTVTDDAGIATVYHDITTVSQLGVCWDIFESHQFKIILDASFENNAFLLAWLYKYGYPLNPNEPVPNFPLTPVIAQATGFSWSLVEEYLNRIMQLTFGRLVESIREAGEEVEQTLSGELPDRDIILAKIINLAVSGQFPTELQQEIEVLNGSHKTLIRQCEMLILGQCLLIQLFASTNNASKPVFEPWMLWEMCKWFGKSSIVITRNRAFDLSPWWG